MLDETMINLTLAIYSMITAVIYFILSLKYKKLLPWSLAIIILSMGLLAIYLQYIDPIWRIVGYFLFLISILWLLCIVFRDYYTVFLQKSLKGNRITLKLGLIILLPGIFLIFPYFPILFRFQLYVLYLLILGSIAFYQLYTLDKTPTSMMMLLTMMGAVGTMIFKVLSPYGIMEGILELSYQSNIIFITFILITPLIAYFEERLVSSEIGFQRAHLQGELYRDIFTHDINNILQNLLGFLDLLELYNEENDSMDIIYQGKNQIQRGKDLGQNLRILSDLKNKKIKLTRIDADKMINDVISKIEDRYNKEDLIITQETGQQSSFVIADEFLFNLLYNLLVNAIDHNDQRQKEIIIKTKREVLNKHKYIQFSIIDNGRGFPERAKKMIFDPSLKLETYNMRRGLGLLLVREIIYRYKGKIWIEYRDTNNHANGSIVNFLLYESRSN